MSSDLEFFIKVSMASSTTFHKFKPFFLAKNFIFNSVATAVLYSWRLTTGLSQGFPNFYMCGSFYKNF
jgi:hypothetical protein